MPLAHAYMGTEAHLRAISVINDDEDITMEFTPTMVKINILKGGVAKT